MDAIDFEPETASAPIQFEPERDIDFTPEAPPLSPEVQALLGSWPKSPLERVAQAEDARNVALDQPFASVQPSGAVTQSPPQNNPEANMAEVSKAWQVPGNLTRAAVTDLVDAAMGKRPSDPNFSTRGDDNTGVALANALRDTAADPEGAPLPVDVRNAQLSQSSPAVATVAKIGQGITGSLPLIVAGGLPAWAQKLVALGFTTQMIMGAGESAKTLGTEMGKNPAERDKDAMTTAVSDLVQTVGFAPFAGLHGVREVVERYADKPTHAARLIADHLAAQNIPDGAGLIHFEPEGTPNQPPAPPQSTPPPPAPPAEVNPQTIAELQAALRGNQLKPVDPSRVEVRTPDGNLDHVQTAIARLRLENEQAPSEPPPLASNATPTSQSDAGATVSPAPVASDEASAPATDAGDLTPAPDNATVPPAAPVTDTVRTVADDDNASQRGQFPAEPATVRAEGVTAEEGSNPSLGAATSPFKPHRVTRADQSRPFDLIDHVEGQVGPIDPRLIQQADSQWRPVGAARKLFKKGGVPADSALDALGPGLGLTRDSGLDDFGHALNEAAQARKAWRQRFYGEERRMNAEAKQTIQFQKDVGRQTQTTEPLVSDDLNEGDTFTLKGANFKVTRLDYDEDGRVTHLTLDDGKTYGTQEVSGETALRMDKGSLERGPAKPAPSAPRYNLAGQGDDEAINSALKRESKASVQRWQRALLGDRWADYRRKQLQARIESLQGQEGVLQPAAARALAKVPRTPQGELTLSAFKQLPEQDLDAIFHLDHIRQEIAETRRNLAGLSSLVYPGVESQVEAVMRGEKPFRYNPGEQPGFFDQPESVADQKAREAREGKQAADRHTREALAVKAAKRLTGKSLDDTGEMFGGVEGGETRQDQSGQGSLFAAGGDLTGGGGTPSIQEAINEKYERAKTQSQGDSPGANQRYSHAVRRAESTLGSLFEKQKEIFGDAARDPGFRQSDVGQKLEAIARQHGAVVVFYKGDSFAPKGFFHDGAVFLRSNRPASELFTTLEHELLHLRRSNGDDAAYFIARRVDLDRPAGKAIWDRYNAYLDSKGAEPLSNQAAAEEVAAFLVSGEHPWGIDPAEAFFDPKEAVNLAREYHGAQRLPDAPEGGDTPLFAPGEAGPERERSADQVKTELAEADQHLQEAIASRTTKAKGDFQRDVALATARYRELQDELRHHPDYIAEQLQKQHDAITEANEILKPHGLAVRTEDYPNPEKLAQVLTPDQQRRFAELQRAIERSHAELVRMPGKMVSRIHAEMQDDGRLPKAPALTDLGAGRTLDRMTQFLKANTFSSPQGTFAERLALGKKFADTVAGAKDAVSKAMLKSQAAWKAMVEAFKGPPVDDDYRSAKKSWLAYDQQTAHENYQYAKALTDAVPLKVRRNAMSVWLDADGDQGLLKFQRDSVPDKYREIWDAALKLTPDEKRIALDVKANFAAKLEDAVATGLVQKGREDYGVPQRWKIPPEANSGPLDGSRTGKPGNPFAKLDPRDPFFSFQRQTPSYFDGIMAKGEPENLDIAHLVTVYDAGFHKALGSRGWIAALQDAAAKDGLPVVKISGKASAANSAEGGKAYFVDSKARAPGDATADGRPYRAVDHFALRDWKVAFKDDAGNPIIVRGDMLVHPDYFDDVKNELETPTWTTQGMGGAALKVNAFLKSSKFIGPFHVVTEALHAIFHGVAPSVRGFEIDLNDPKQALLSRNMTLGFGRAREMFEDGLSSHGGIWSKVPGLGAAVVRMNSFTFNEYIPRLKMKVGLAVLERNLGRYKGTLTDEQIGALTGRQMDAAFGGQNWRLIGANKTTLAVLRLGLVAPDFLISRAKVIGQAFKPYNQEQRVFLLAQAAGVYALARVLNATFSDDHDPHWEPRNWDSVVIGKRAYHARFLVSDAANLARDLMGLGSFNQHGIPFITGRLGVVPKTGVEALTGKDLFTGQNKDGLFDADNPLLKAFSIVAKDTAEWMTPMGVDGFMPGAAARGQAELGSAMAATVGVSSRRESPANELWDLARQYNLQSKDPAAVSYQTQRDNDSGTPSQYRALNNLLDAGQPDQVKRELERLQSQGKTLGQIASHYERQTYFTGSARREHAFYATLTPAQQKRYQQAKAEQAERAKALGSALSASPTAP